MADDQSFWQTSATMTERPLSPHLSVYRFGYTMASSIFHRITGAALAVVLLGFVFWLYTIAAGRDVYQSWQPCFTSVPARVLVALAGFALIYHTCAGIRHLLWDVGYGFERQQARRNALILVIVVALLTALFVFALVSGAREAA